MKRKNDQSWFTALAGRLLFLIVIAPLLTACILGFLVGLLSRSTAASLSEGADETVIVPFTSDVPIYTQNTYTGNVLLIVSGYGQAGGTDFSDAFYLYAYTDGTLYEPPLLFHFDMEIDGQRAIHALGLSEDPPSYARDHVYRVVYEVGDEPRRIAFRQTDLYQIDNTGEYRVEVYHGE